MFGPDIKVGYLWVLAVGKVAGYLPMAKPVAFNLLGIRYDCATVLTDVAGQLVVLSEGHDRGCCMRPREVCLKFVRPGNKAV